MPSMGWRDGVFRFTRKCEMMHPMSVDVAIRSDDEITATIASNFRALCAVRCVSRVEVARALGCTPGSISQKAMGVRPFSAVELVQVADLLGVEVSDLVVRREGLEPSTRWLMDGGDGIDPEDGATWTGILAA